MGWDAAYTHIKKSAKPADSKELRKSFIESCQTDEWGEAVVQDKVHDQIQNTLFEWEQLGQNEAIISAPFGAGKSQQLPIGLGVYFQTRVPEESNGVITADPGLSKKRIKAIRSLVEKDNYRLWCMDHNFEPLEYCKKKDSYSSEEIYFRSKNDTGNPSFFAAGIETGGTGYRFWRLWGDDICDVNDFNSEATRKRRFNAWTQTWTPRVYDGGFVYLIRTPYHPEDANERLIKSGVYNHLEIAVNEEKTGYTVKEWRKQGNLLMMNGEKVLPLWNRNHSYEKLCKAQKENYASYMLGYRMLKEVQNPEMSTYLNFSKENVANIDFDWSLGSALVLTCDFNVNPMSWVLGQKQGDNYVVLYEIIGENITTSQHAVVACRLISELGHSFVELHGDGTSNQGGQRYGRSGESDWKTVRKALEQAGIQYLNKVGKSNPQRNERIKVVNNVIYTELAEQPLRRLLVHPRCQTVVDDYKFSVRDSNELKKKKQGKRGHISDAVDYWIYKSEKSGNYTYLLR